MAQAQLRRNEEEAFRQEEGDAIRDNPAILKQVVDKCNHDKLCDIVTEQMQIHDEVKNNLASLSVAAAAKHTKCKRS